MTTSTFSSPRAVVSGDLLLVNRGNVSYQVDATELNTVAQDSDLLLLNRGGKSYKCRYDSLDDALDTDLLLINRGSNSYRITMGEIRGVIASDVTFTISLASPTWQGAYGGGWNQTGGREPTVEFRTAYGGVVTATITAPSDTAYVVDAIPGSGLGFNTQFSLNNEWIMIAGGAGGVSEQRIDYPTANGTGSVTCIEPSGGKDALGLSAVGVNNVGPGGPMVNWGSAPSWRGTTPGVGGGCPAGVNAAPYAFTPGSDPGYSQTRNRAENTGDVWGDYTITNVSWARNETLPGYSPGQQTVSGTEVSITCNGITKQYKNVGNITDLPLSGVIGEFLEWT